MKCNKAVQHFHDKAIHQDYDAVNQTNYFQASSRIYFDNNLLFIVKYLIMKNLFFKKAALKAGLFAAICLTAFMVQANAGLDYYEIYIGKKLILKRAVNQPLSLNNLPLSQANSNDQLIIYYYQCNAPDKLGSNRVIVLKDANGNKVKKWKFADAKGADKGMVIPVKELLQLQQEGNNSLALFYSAEGREQGEKIAMVAGKSKTVGFWKENQNDNKISLLALLAFARWRFANAV